MKTNEFLTPVDLKKKPLPAVTVYGEKDGQTLSRLLYDLIPGQPVRFITPANRDELLDEVYHSAIVFIAVDDVSDENINLAKDLTALPGVVADIIAITPVQEIRQRLHMLTYDFDNIFNREILETEDFRHIFRHKLEKGIRRLQARIQEDEYRSFQAFLSVSPDAFIIFDRNKRVLFVSGHYHKLYRQSGELLLRGTPVNQIFEAASRESGVTPEDPRYQIAKDFWTKLEGHFEFHVSPTKVLRITAVPLPDGEGTIVTTTDISLYKLQERTLAEKQAELQEALRKEQEASDLQKQFISMVSHEFRTPLSIIDGNAQILERRIGTLPSDETGKRLKTVRSAVSRLVNMMEAVLSSSMLKTGRLDLHPEDFDLASLIRELCQEQADLSSRHRIEFDAGDLPNSVTLDKKIVTLILTNLLSNAVKFTKDDPLIKVAAVVRSDGYSVSVEDNGVGIPDNELPHIFERFFRATTSSGVAGSGVGLALVKDLVALHRGSVAVSSVLGKGTKFDIVFPSLSKTLQKGKVWL